MTSAAHQQLSKLFGSMSDGQDDGRLEEMIRNTDSMMRLPARTILGRIGLDKSVTVPFSLLDHACGIGPVAAELQETVDGQVLAESRILCADFNGNLVDMLKRRATLKGWSKIETANLDAQNSGLPNESFSHVSINFAMHIVPDPQAVLRDLMKVLKPGGKLGFTVWHQESTSWAPDMRSCFEALPFEASFPDPMPMAPHGFPHWTEEQGIQRELRDHGYTDIRTEKIRFTTHVDGAEQFVNTFDMPAQWIARSYWSEESLKKAEGMLKEHMLKHLKEKHSGQGWDLDWTFVVATCEKPTA